MDLMEAIYRRRSIRRFSPQPVEKDKLYEMVKAARMAPQASNIQPLQYMIVHQKELLEPVFACTRWAGYLEHYAPEPSYRPTAYIVVLLNEEIKKNGNDTDAGLAIENMLLAAVAQDLGTCLIGSVDRQKIRTLLGVPEQCQIHSIVAVGYPAEQPVWEEMPADSIRYYLDEEKRLHVPKRHMSDILLPIQPHLED